MGFFDFFKRGKTQATEAAAEAATPEYKDSLEQGLKQTKSSFFSKITKAIAGRSTVDAEFLDDLEEALVTADVGIKTTVKIIERLEARVAKEKYLNSKELSAILRQTVQSLIADVHNSYPKDKASIQPQEGDPYCILVVGVNGVGKTTTIGKLAYRFKSEGFQVVLGAGDTFRAAAVDQLQIWADRVGASFISRGMQADPASVAFDALTHAKSKNADVVIIDTAGRLHNKVNLMNELGKIGQVMAKAVPDAPHEVLLVLDASTGQNALEQAKQFTAITKVTGLVLTKLDGTAKGGVVLAIMDQMQIPVKYIGLGEKMTDLRLFDPEAFVNALFEDADIEV